MHHHYHLQQLLTCFKRFVVFILGLTDVFKTVPINLTFADAPSMVASVIVTVALPVPDMVSVISTNITLRTSSTTSSQY